MRRLWILGLPFLVVMSGGASGVFVSPPTAAAYDDDYRDYRDYDDDHRYGHRSYRHDDDDEDDDLGSDVTVRYFRDDLTPYGEWFQIPRYGWVWRPFNVGGGWRPYTVGRWIDTDYGWTWVSDEPWGRAPYHYGRWFWDDRYGGWIWVPGRRWAPAWVDWRQGDGYVGWAPLPPAAVWQPGVGIPTRTIVIEPRHYCFVETRYIVEPQVVRYVAPPTRNVTIIHNTTNITNYTIVNNRVANHSIREAFVEKAIGRQVPRFPVAEVENARPRPLGTKGQWASPAQPPPRVERSDRTQPAPAGQPRSIPPAAVEHDRGRIDQERAAALERERAEREQRDKAERDRQEGQQRERARLEDEQRRQADREQRDKAERQRQEGQQRERARLEDEQRRQADREQRDKVERQRQEGERRERARLEEEQRRQADRVREQERQQNEERAREAARQQNAERQRETLQRQEMQRQEMQRQQMQREAIQRRDQEQRREAAQQQQMRQQQEAERSREQAERRRQEDAARRHQAEQQRQQPPQHPVPPGQAPSQP